MWQVIISTKCFPYSKNAAGKQNNTFYKSSQQINNFQAEYSGIWTCCQSWTPKPKIAKKPNLAIVSAPKEIHTEETGTGSAVASKKCIKGAERFRFKVRDINHWVTPTTVTVSFQAAGVSSLFVLSQNIKNVILWSCAEPGCLCTAEQNKSLERVSLKLPTDSAGCLYTKLETCASTSSSPARMTGNGAPHFRISSLSAALPQSMWHQKATTHQNWHQYLLTTVSSTLPKPSLMEKHARQNHLFMKTTASTFKIH